MIEIDNTVQLKPEEVGKEFGNVPFQELPNAQTSVLKECLVGDTNDKSPVSGLKITNDTPVQKDLPVEISVSDDTMKTLQEEEDQINNLRKLWASNKLCKKTFIMERDVLNRIIIEDGIMYNPVVLPEILRDSVPMLAHEKQGHNGARRVYNSIKRLYHWKGMKKHIQFHCTYCYTCAKFNTKAQEFEKKTFLKPPTTHGIYLHGPNRGVQSSLSYGQQACIDSSLYVNWLHILYSHRDQVGKRCCKCIPQPHLLHIWTF